MPESIHDAVEPMHSEAIPQPDSIESIDSLVKAVVGQSMGGQEHTLRRAVAAWFGANGDRERAHTTRVFVKAPRTGVEDPIICVYVDSHAYVTDLNANRDLYLARLANWGYHVSGIEFSVDREARRKVVAGRQDTAQPASHEKPLSPEQQAYVQQLLEGAPEALRSSISKAIIASIQATDQF